MNTALEEQIAVNFPDVTYFLSFCFILVNSNSTLFIVHSFVSFRGRLILLYVQLI